MAKRDSYCFVCDTHYQEQKGQEGQHHCPEPKRGSPEEKRWFDNLRSKGLK